MKALIISLCVLVIGFSVNNLYTSLNPKQPKPLIIKTKIENKELPKYGNFEGTHEYLPVVRLHDSKNRFFCTGIVIDSHYIVTAAHCLFDLKTFQITPEKIKVYNHTKSYNVEATAVAVNNRADYGMITGDFSKFNYAEIEQSPHGIFTKLGETCITCGYPYGGKLFCTEASILTMKIHFFNISYEYVPLYPGMSGGPMKCGDKVVAVNSTMWENKAILAPLVEIFESLEIPY